MDSVAEETPALPRAVRALKDSSKSDSHARTVVICLDGTGDRFDADNSNVVHFVSCLKKHVPREQVTYYQSGIGTYDEGGLSNGINAALDMAVGSGLGVHVKDAYKFLMQNYRDGDKICLLGFSRGAYTVRCLAGMLHKVGLLPASNGAQVNFAYNFYKDDTKNGWKMSGEFKKTFCTDVNVHFVGLWDCVASVGLVPRKLPFSKTPTNSIRYFRHAMALDEHRAKFKVCRWQQQNPDLARRVTETVDKTPTAHLSRGIARTLTLCGIKSENTTQLDASKIKAYETGLEYGPSHQPSNDASKRDEEQYALQKEFEEYDASRRERHLLKTDALEVWFMGAHADIGGGSVPNETRHALSRIPLRWMIRQCFECDTGICFDMAMLCEMGMDVHTLWPVVKPVTKPPTGPSPHVVEKYNSAIGTKGTTFPPLQLRSAFLNFQDGNEERKVFQHEHELAHLPEPTEDHFDGMAPVNDQLVHAKIWWILEFWPVKVRVLSKDGQGWEKKVRLNLGRHRAIRETEPYMHWTVERMVEEGKYAVKARMHPHAHWEIAA